MLRISSLAAIALTVFLHLEKSVDGLSLSMVTEKEPSISSRRRFFSGTAIPVVAAVSTAAISLRENAVAAPVINNLSNGIKYAITQDVAKGSYPQEGDIIAIEYTGYLSNGAIFDSTHSIGKKNALLFKSGSTAVNKGINSMVGEMKVGQKVQAIIPPELAFGDKGICLEDGECLVKPGATIVYDIFLKKASIPPP
mmetsp:Transcript_18334/g.42250  ORF Transcript_18334/g.42250 Transcript_18334/m.42250 type:complete len:196 (-) Transcript_18334:2603-3190(-)